MYKRLIALLLAALTALGGLLVWNRQRPRSTTVVGREVEEVPASATSLSAQPHKRVRVAPPKPNKGRAVPPPDSADEGRTPYYFVPGEALLTLHGPEPLTGAILDQIAAQVEGVHAPLGAEGVSYPAPEGAGFFTILRVQWPTETGYEESLARFAKLETQINTGIAWEEGRVATWMPNWLGSVATAERLYTPGGPAAYPRPVPTPATGLPLADTSFLHEWRAAMQQPITLAIVDTFPTADSLPDSPDSLPPSLRPLVARLRQDARPLTLDSTRHYATFRTGLPFDMSDHGLMAAWLASEVIGETGMAHVTLEPVRVASREGICSAADVIAGLAPLARRVHAGESMVVLLAFVIGMGDIIPPRLRHYEEHYEALRLVCLSISEAGGTLVGAAGNDASGLQHPPRTRLPASFRSVIEVTAGQLAQSDLALYANQAKALCLFGGEANLQYEMADNIPALVGPALASHLRVSNDQHAPNESGWVAWAGTSFAAALAAGLAVMRRSQNPTARMWEIRTELRKVATASRQPGNVPFIDLIRPAS